MTLSKCWFEKHWTRKVRKRNNSSIEIWMFLDGISFWYKFFFSYERSAVIFISPERFIFVEFQSSSSSNQFYKKNKNKINWRMFKGREKTSILLSSCTDIIWQKNYHHLMRIISCNHASYIDPWDTLTLTLIFMFFSIPSISHKFLRFFAVGDIYIRDWRYCKNWIPPHTVYRFDSYYTVPYRAA